MSNFKKISKQNNIIKKVIIFIIFVFVIVLLFNIEFFYRYISSRYFLKNNNKMETIPNSILDLPNNYYYKSDLSNEKLVTLVAHYNEDLTWINDTKSPFIISSKNTKDKNLYVSLNKGNEVSAYLSYIIKYYDALPEYTLFLHGHFIDWHQFSKANDIINKLEYLLKNDNSIEYLNVNNIGIDDRYQNNPTIEYLRVNVWKNVFEEELGPMPTAFYDKCCAQFLVKRERIKLRSKKFYSRLLNYVLYEDEYKVDATHYISGYIFEYIWHYIFGEPAFMNYNNSRNSFIGNNFYYRDFFSV